MWHARERGETCTGFWWESLKEIDQLEDQGINGSMGLGVEGVEWIHLAQDRDQWQAVMNAVMNLWVLVPQN
jgi:hypothetical protein